MHNVLAGIDQGDNGVPDLGFEMVGFRFGIGWMVDGLNRVEGGGMG